MPTLSDLHPDQVDEFIDSLDPKDAQRVLYDWKQWARDNQRMPTGTDWIIWLIMAGRGYGKLLACNTPIPTPAGWKLLSEIAVGDEIFDEAGNPCFVTGVHGDIPRQAYRITFSDHTTIDAGGEHLWATWTHAERKAFLRSPYEDTARMPENWPKWKLKRLHGPQLSKDVVGAALTAHAEGHSLRKIESLVGANRASLSRYVSAGTYLEREPVIYPDSPGPHVRSTDAILASLRYGNRGDLNHSIPTTAALNLPDANLPIAPYVFGYWLGDGTTKEGSITVGDDDASETLAYFSFDGYSVRSSRTKENARCSTYVLESQDQKHRTMSSDLRQLGVLRNKHIPDAYLRSSATQRLLLLQGLMDSDGTVSANNGQVEYTTIKKALAYQFVELARTLGQKPVVTEGDATLYGRVTNKKYRVTFRPTIDLFRLRRKRDRLNHWKNSGQQFRHHHRMITDIRPIPLQQMRCLSVDSPNNLFLAGEGMIPTHNTRTGAESVRALQESGRYNRFGLVGQTPADVRDIMVEGESGILACSPPWNYPKYEPSKRRLTWPNGATATTYSAENPDQLNGPQHDAIWGDEVGLWGKNGEAYSMMQFGLRLGPHPIQILTTTPRPVVHIRKLVERFQRGDKAVVITSGSSYENRGNLTPQFYSEVIAPYEGTELGRQQIYGELLEEAEGALWKRSYIDDNRVKEAPKTLRTVVVGVDPAGGGGDEIGIIVAGKATGDEWYVLEDASLRGTPEAWARAVVGAYDRWSADYVVAETNYGGEMVRSTIRVASPSLPVQVITATRGKAIRAQPSSFAYSKGLVHHVGELYTLEDQMVNWVPEEANWSPDRMDALVWALTALRVGVTGGGLAAIRV